ncbi:hypothetical protein NKG94_42385 [Micromonospora sp. M12]
MAPAPAEQVGEAGAERGGAPLGRVGDAAVGVAADGETGVQPTLVAEEGAGLTVGGQEVDHVGDRVRVSGARERRPVHRRPCPLAPAAGKADDAQLGIGESLQLR